MLCKVVFINSPSCSFFKKASNPPSGANSPVIHSVLKLAIASNISSTPTTPSWLISKGLHSVSSP